MNTPTLVSPTRIDPDVVVFNFYVPLPGYGILPANCFLVRSTEPVLVDTGLGLLRDEFLEQLEKEINLKEIGWIWLTHGDADHIGNLPVLLEKAPNARVVTTYLGMGKLMLWGVPIDRMFLLNPGEKLNVGDRELLAMVPPTMDAPETCGFYDLKTRHLFTSDSFGAILQNPATYADEIDKGVLREGSLTWSRLDDPWLRLFEQEKFMERIEQFKNLQTNMIFSSHLPPVKNIKNELLAIMEESLIEESFTPPNELELEEILSGTIQREGTL